MYVGALGLTSFVEARACSRVRTQTPCHLSEGKDLVPAFEMTPDHHAILESVPEVPGFFLANGFSGHGVMHAPATGKILADLILRGNTDLIDASVINLARFAEGRMIHETALL